MVFKEDYERRQAVLRQARDRLNAQIQQNQARQRRIAEQKHLVAQKKQAQVLVQTFKNAINAVVEERKQKLQKPFLTKDQLQPQEKKQILELFVENDNTLSHLLEFISSKLVDSNNMPALSAGGSTSVYSSFAAD